ncbi:MAG TPA: (Fe-S)-binding protein, partial [Candidatus Methylacidiphilales bacterium]|nr:(Fe-S)-binding protein [Candidatus Methylacidiphilales bacterium]
MHGATVRATMPRTMHAPSHAAFVDVTTSGATTGALTAGNLLRELDYGVVQQCMHCGMCLPTCPTYDATKLERNSPRGRIALMRSIADGRLESTKAFAEEMYFCLGCLACETACPAGVDYMHLFEVARAEAERSGAIANPQREVIRSSILRVLFTQPSLLRAVGMGLRFYQDSGLQQLVRDLNLTAILPERYRNLEKQAPNARAAFSDELMATVERPAASEKTRYRVGLLTGCVQDIIFSEVNRDTADVLLANGCEVHTPSGQYCCGSLHGHNGDLETARELARKNLDLFDLQRLDAIITNAAGCGSHLKHYDRLLEDDPLYYPRAVEWSRKLRDIHEFLSEVGFRAPASGCAASSQTV